MKRTLIALLTVVAALAGQTNRSELRLVRAVRCWPMPEATRVVIEVSGEFDYTAERAYNPERVFFDISGARPRIEGRRYYSANVTDRLVKRVRVAETRPGVTRVVLDLGEYTRYTATQLSNPDRLIIELRPDVPPAAPPAVQTTLAVDLPAPPAVTPNPVSTQAPPLAATLQTPAPPVVVARVAVAPPVPVRQPAVPSISPAPPLSKIEPPQAANLRDDGPNSLTRVLGLKIRRVVLDPGHGGHDEGTSGPRGLKEKDLVLDVALRLGKLIETRMGSEVIYTRNDDTFIPLRERTALANDKKADLFLSIHANSSPYPRVGGVESYFLNFTDSKDALALAARENASSDQSVFELRDLIQKITLHDKVEESRELASRVQDSLFGFAVHYNSGIKNRGVKKAPFVVLIGASMPSVLAEIGFLSNPKEEALLKKPEHRQKLAEALYRAVSRYSQSLSHYQMAQVQDTVKR